MAPTRPVESDSCQTPVFALRRVRVCRGVRQRGQFLRAALDLRYLGQLVIRDAVLGELPRGHEQAVLERLDRLVVGADRRVEPAPCLGEMTGEDAETLVEI